MEGGMRIARAQLFLASALVLTIVVTSNAQGGQGAGGGRQNMPGGGQARGGNMPGPPASMSLAMDFAIDFQAQEDLILKAADAMPADKFDFKPTPPQQTFGERLMHIVQVNG